MKTASAVIFCSLLCLCNTAALYGQFHFDQIDDDGVYGYYRKLEWYPVPRYNRVEGLFAGAALKYRPENVTGLVLSGEAGWGFWNEDAHAFQFNAGIRKDMFEFRRLSLGLDVFKRLASMDDWYVSDLENSFWAVLFRQDRKDYYGLTGGRLYVDHKFLEVHTLRVEIGRWQYEMMQKNIDWSIFKGTFAENATRSDSPILEGDELSVRLITAFDWRDNPVFPLTGWYLAAIYEHTAMDFDTDGLFVILKRYQTTWGNHRAVLRFMAASRHGSLAEQHRLDLGGIGGLRGYADKEFSGNRLMMINIDYMFGGDLLQRIPLQNLPFFGPLWSTLSLALFFDAGWVGETGVTDGILNGFDDVSLKSDVGFSVSVLDGIFRADVAKRTDRSNDDIRVTFRLLQSF
jgi:outer membrane protein assembly factor BamA